ncbi:hypothetical protein GPALN_013235 [Globodera pallida]|nr:hypothetical protein GPALN_013235 [Globodera pallida]
MSRPTLMAVLMFIGVLLAMFNPSMEVRPPAYLGICEWRECVGEKPTGSHLMICLPEERPENCLQESWDQLTELNELEPC